MSAGNGQHWLTAVVSIDGAHRRCLTCNAVNTKDVEKCRFEYGGQPHELGQVVKGLPERGTYDG